MSPIPPASVVALPSLLSRVLMTGLGLLVVTARADLTVELVNDSGLPDTEVYALLVGQPLQSGGSISVSGISVAYGSGNNPPVSSQTVGSLASAGFSVESQFSGRTLPVYQFSIASIASGALMVSYRIPISYDDANPSPITSNFRFDQCELTFDPTISSVANLTSIDAYAIPMQLEVYGAKSTHVPISRRTYYTSTEGLIARFAALGCSTAFYGIGSASPVRWKPSSGINNFLRILGPGKISSTQLSGNPAPFPSFGAYLASLLNAGGSPYQFTLSGNASASSYEYQGTVQGDGDGGYQIVLTGTTTPPPPSPLPPNAAVTVHLPSGNAPGAQQTINFDSFIYGAVLDTSSFSVAGVSGSVLSNQVNSVYGAIARDTLSSLNFGYMNGRYGSQGSVWYGVPPSQIPFGTARKTNDGFYNPWAGVLYNESDAYGFAFSDRSGPSPAVPLKDNQTLRITILPDRRLDSPKVTVTATNSTSVSLRWPGVPGATGYDVNILVPGHHPTVHVPAGSSNVITTLTGLNPGTPYTFTVTAVGSASGRAVHSPGIPQQVLTTGTLVPVNVSGGVQFSFSFNWIPADASGLGVHINGVPLSYVPSSQQWLINGANAAASGIVGTNEYVLTVTDGSEVLFANIIATSFSGTPSSFDVGLHHLFGNQVALSLAAPPNEPPYTPNALVMGVPFVPNPTKAFSPVRFPSHTYTEWAAQYPDLADAGPDGNPDRDGAVNLVEYFRGTLPDEAETSRFEALVVEPDAVLFRYRKSQRTLDVVESIQWTTDFRRWFTTGVVSVGDEDFGNWQLRTVRVPLPPGLPLYVRYNIRGDSEGETMGSNIDY